MSRPAPPVLTVRYSGAERTFAAGNDVVVGRDLRADVRVADPLISRIHVLLRFDQGRWMAIDNGSLNGVVPQQPACADYRHSGRPAHQYRQPGRSGADLRGGPPPRFSRASSRNDSDADHSAARRAPGPDRTAATAVLAAAAAAARHTTTGNPAGPAYRDAAGTLGQRAAAGASADWTAAGTADLPCAHPTAPAACGRPARR